MAVIPASRRPRSPYNAVPWLYWDSEIPAGTGVSLFVNTEGKNFWRTNMRHSAALPEPHLHLVTSVSVVVWPGTEVAAVAVADSLIASMVSVLEDSFLELRVSDKSMIEGPLHRFPGGGGPYAMVSTDNAGAAATARISTATNGPAMSSKRLILNHPIPINPGEPIRCDVSWGHTVDVSGLPTPFLFVFLGGQLLRGVN